MGRYFQTGGLVYDKSHCSQKRRNIAIVNTESFIKEIKLSNLKSSILITRDLEHNCSLVVCKD